MARKRLGRVRIWNQLIWYLFEAGYVPFHGVLEGISDKVEHDLLLHHVSRVKEIKAIDEPSALDQQTRFEELDQLRRYIVI